MTSASSAWYTSANFWTGAGGAAGVLTVVITIALWLIGTPRRLLVYSVSDTALPNDALPRSTADPRIQVIIGDQVVSDPHVVSVFVECRSRQDIRSADFGDRRPLIFDLGAPILKLLDSDTGDPVMPKIPISIEGRSLTIAPTLINRRQVIKIDVLMDGPATLTCSNSPLADVTVQDGFEFLVYRPKKNIFVDNLICGGGGLWLINHFLLHNKWLNGLIVPVLGIFFAVLIAGVVAEYIEEGGFYWRGTYGDSGRRSFRLRRECFNPEGPRPGWATKPAFISEKAANRMHTLGGSPRGLGCHCPLDDVTGCLAGRNGEDAARDRKWSRSRCRWPTKCTYS